MALLNIAYRDQLFPRDAYRLTFDRLLEKLPKRSACRLMVDLLALAHDRGCETLLAATLTTDLAAVQQYRVWTSPGVQDYLTQDGQGSRALMCPAC